MVKEYDSSIPGAKKKKQIQIETYQMYWKTDEKILCIWISWEDSYKTGVESLEVN